MKIYLLHLLTRSRRLFWALAKVMLPVMLAVRAAELAGLIDLLGAALGPFMALLDLPPQAGLVWVACVFVGIYGGIGALVGLAPQMDLNVAQLSALAAMMLFAHSIPVEQAIVRRAGASFWFTSALRLGLALLYGAMVAWTCRLLGVLDEPVSLGWLQGSQWAAEQAPNVHLAWAQSTLFSLLATYGVILGLLVLLDVLERLGITRRITVALTPLLRLSGLDARVAPVTTVGVLLGLTYGGALIIEEAQKQNFPPRTRLLALSWLSLSHSLIEDTLLMLALGADIWVVLVGRVALTMLVVALMARCLRGGAPEPLRAPARAGG
ncbi:nucleoside recognition domain-containing protein [Orrella sp. JC864]|uniref:nucleoside recognition domain-containing protein n=1 Tax=Orrella sp. JC864 TaxID=3120298 RepID=UPI0012BB816A